MRHAYPLAIALLLWAGPAFGEAPPRPGSVRQALVDLLRGPSASFSGTQRSTVYLDDGGKVAVEVQVLGDGRGALCREYRSGILAGAVVLQRGGHGWQRSPAGAWTELPDAPAAEGSNAAASLEANYAVTVGKPERLAGRSVVRVDLRPRQPFCPSRSVWIDRSTRLVVRDELRAPGGALRSVSEFTSLSLGPQPSARFAGPRAPQSAGSVGPASFSPRQTAADVERETGRSVPVPGHVPTGFKVACYGVMTTGSGRLMPAVRYSDGLAAFTIFERGGGPGNGGGRGRGGAGFGPGRGRGRGGGPGWGRWRGGAGPGPRGQCLSATDGRQQAVVEWRGEQYDYLLVGDITVDELRRVAEALP